MVFFELSRDSTDGVLVCDDFAIFEGFFGGGDGFFDKNICRAGRNAESFSMDF